MIAFVTAYVTVYVTSYVTAYVTVYVTVYVIHVLSGRHHIVISAQHKFNKDVSTISFGTSTRGELGQVNFDLLRRLMVYFVPLPLGT